MNPPFLSEVRLEEGEFEREGGWTIPLLLEEAIALRPTLPVLFPWPVLQSHVDNSDMAALRRHPQLEKLYFLVFNPLVKKEYGSAEAFLRVQLGWQEGDESTPEDAYWTRDAEAVVRRNDWCYSIDLDTTHWVVWTKLPLVHPLLCPPTSDSVYPSPTALAPVTATATATVTATASSSFVHSEQEPCTWENVQKKGLCGFTGQVDSELAGFGGGPEEPGREVAAFIRRRWPEDDFDTCWFVNPPWLQSVRGLSHFHVMSRPKIKRLPS